MESESDKYLLMLYTIHKFKSISGKKALQKILYFVNHDKDLLNFQWHKFGPYSEELKYMLDDAVLEGLVNISPINLTYSTGKQFNMKLTKQGDKYVNSSVIDQNLLTSIDSIYNFLHNENPRTMELLASIHYIISNTKITDNEKIFNIISDLKPESHFNKKEITEAKNKLLTNNFIKTCF